MLQGIHVASTQKLCYHTVMTLFPVRETVSDHVTGRNEKVIAFLLILVALFIVARIQPRMPPVDSGIDWEPKNIGDIYRKLSSPRTQADVEQMRAIMSRQITVDP
jgi:hypothetical protein